MNKNNSNYNNNNKKKLTSQKQLSFKIFTFG